MEIYRGGGIWNNISNLKGPQGDKGDKGDTGAPAQNTVLVYRPSTSNQTLFSTSNIEGGFPDEFFDVPLKLTGYSSQGISGTDVDDCGFQKLFEMRLTFSSNTMLNYRLPVNILYESENGTFVGGFDATVYASTFGGFNVTVSKYIPNSYIGGALISSESVAVQTINLWEICNYVTLEKA